MNTRGLVLVDGGKVITQIVAILLHLDAKFPQAHVLPASGLARTCALEVLACMNNTVHPTFTHVFMPQQFTDDKAAQKALMEFNAQRHLECLAESEILAAKAAPWMVGEKPGASMPMRSPCCAGRLCRYRSEWFRGHLGTGSALRSLARRGARGGAGAPSVRTPKKRPARVSGLGQD